MRKENTHTHKIDTKSMKNAYKIIIEFRVRKNIDTMTIKKINFEANNFIFAINQIVQNFQYVHQTNEIANNEIVFMAYLSNTYKRLSWIINYGGEFRLAL